jgi:tetratricopeptide (TPR) repeat protein
LRLSHFSREIDKAGVLVRSGDVLGALAIAEDGVAKFGGDDKLESYWRYHLLRLGILGYLGQADRYNSILENELASEPPFPELAIALRILRGSWYCGCARYRESRELLDDAARLAADGGYAALEQFYRRGLEIGTSLNDRYIETVAMAGVAKNVMRSGRHAEATECFLELRRTADELGERLFSAMLACEIAWGFMNQRDYVPALNVLLEAEPVLRDAGVKHLYSICEADIGYIYLQWGSYAVAISYFQRALQVAQEAGDVVSQRKWTQNLAFAYGRLGNDAASASFAEAAAFQGANLAARQTEVQ